MHIFSPGLSSRGIGEDGWTDQRGRVSECICQTDKEKGMLEILERGGGYDALKTMQCVCACVRVCGGGQYCKTGEGNTFVFVEWLVVYPHVDCPQGILNPRLATS